MKHNNFRFAGLAAWLPVIALALAGCATPPNANVQPAGKPGLVQGGIPVEITQASVKVTALDAGLHTITLQHDDGATKTFSLTDSVKNLDQIKVGDIVNATVQAELSVYILDHGMVPGADGAAHARTINFNARVLKIDARRRLLTLQFINGQTLTIKAAPEVMLDKMAPGDDVIMRSNRVTGISLKK